MNKNKGCEDSQKVEKILTKQGLIRPMAITLKAVVIKKEESSEEKVLLLRRSKKELTNKNKWDLPGGHIEKGETIEEGLIREVKEEAGVDVKMGSIIGMTEFEKDHECFEMEKRGLRFIAYYQSGEVELNKKEHRDFKWVTFNEALEMLNKKDGFENEKREVIKVAKDYFEKEMATEKWKRSLADFDNFKKRIFKQNEEFKKYCTEDFVLELLPVIDNFEMSTAFVPEGLEGDGWVAGIMHIKTQLVNVLESKGVSEIAVKEGDEFDEEIHEVVAGKKVSDKEGGKKNPEKLNLGASKKNKITKVLKKGYKLNDRIIRPATIEIE